MISARLAAIDPEHCIGLHSNMLLAFPQDATGIELNEQELADLVEVAEFMKTGAAYQEIQGKNPQTLAYGLTDSPAGTRGLDRREVLPLDRQQRFAGRRGHARADPHQHHRLLGDGDDQLVDASLLRVATRPELRAERRFRRRFRPPPRCFPKEMFRIPKAYAASRFNLVRYTRFDRGGHFAALEEPDLLVPDIREFFEGLQ